MTQVIIAELMGQNKLFTYKDFERDILFEGIQPSTKDKKKRDFIDCCKCLVWEENRTRYELDESFREKIDLSRFYATSHKEKDALDTWMDLSVELTRELDFYSTNFPFNVPYFPSNAYLKYIHKTREKWKYDPTEGRKRYERELLFMGCKGDNKPEIQEIQRFDNSDSSKKKDGGKKLICEKVNAKRATRTVPIIIHIDPLADPSVSKRIVTENFDGIMHFVSKNKALMEKKGYEFLSDEQIADMKRQQRDFVEYYGQKYSPFDPIFKTKTLNAYNSTLSFLGLYRLLECEGLKWHEVEAKYKKYFKRNGDIPMSFDHYKKKVRSVLKLLPQSKF